MNKDPAFLFYSSDFLMGNLLMSFEDRGKFITILSYMHQHGRLKERTIKQLVGDISDELKSKFRMDEDDFWYSKRLEFEMSKRIRFVESCRVNGRLGGRPAEKKKTEENEETFFSEKFPFDAFWKMYDKPTEKQNCEAKWAKLHNSDKEVIMEKLPAYVKATPERQYRKNPLTYINKKIWLDELIPEPPKMKKKSAFKQLAETGSYE